LPLLGPDPISGKHLTLKNSPRDPVVGYPARFGSTTSSKQTNKQILPASQPILQTENYLKRMEISFLVALPTFSVGYCHNHHHHHHHHDACLTASVPGQPG